MTLKFSKLELRKMLNHAEQQLNNAIIETDRIVWRNWIIDIKEELEKVKA